MEMANLVLEQTNTAAQPTTLDIASGTPIGIVVRYNNGNGLGILGDPSMDTGVVGFGARGVSGIATNDIGVGVAGLGDRVGVAGDSIGQSSVGVRGNADFLGVIGTASTSLTNKSVAGVHGESSNRNGIGVNGQSDTFIGVRGIAGRLPSANSAGVMGIGQILSHGVIGMAPIPAFAGAFFGNVSVDGDFVCTGHKGAAVRFSDGSRRLLCAIESPESWFEDFGLGRLVRGRAAVRLDRHFRAVTRGTYHVFLTPEGDCSLYVTRKTTLSFQVRAVGGASVSVPFSYRIVAHRRDVAGTRFARLKLPQPPKGVEVPIAAPKAPEMPDVATFRRGTAAKRKSKQLAKPA